MKAAVISAAGQPPRYLDFPEPQPAPQQHIIQVRAAAISQVVKSRATGSHYSATGQFPFIAGIDGTGQLASGERVYFVMPDAPLGSMAELTRVATSRCVALPDDLDDVTAAAIANPGMSSWAALTRRAQLKPGETVLINGATGTSGRLAVRIARQLGAGKVIVTGRRRSVLDELAQEGADSCLTLDELSTALPALFKQGIDVVLDYLWGPSALAIMEAAVASGSRTVRYVQIGSLSGQEITLHSKLLRSSALTLMGSGIGSVSLSELVACVGELLAVTRQAGLVIACRPLPLSQLDHGWASDDSRCRTVFTLP